jgi:hypothetical protein
MNPIVSSLIGTSGSGIIAVFIMGARDGFAFTALVTAPSFIGGGFTGFIAGRKGYSEQIAQWSFAVPTFVVAFFLVHQTTDEAIMGLSALWTTSIVLTLLILIALPSKVSPPSVPPPAIANTPTKTCPYCAEVIMAQAIKCRFCGSELSSSPPRPPPLRVPATPPPLTIHRMPAKSPAPPPLGVNEAGELRHRCDHCGQPMMFPANGLGMKVNCPHCECETALKANG